MRNRLVPHPHVTIKNWDDISAVEVTSKEQGVLDPHQNPQDRVLVPGKEIPITSGCKTNRYCG